MRTGSEYEKPNRDKEAKAVDSFESEVDHPDRYANYNLECINFIREVLGDEGAMYFCLGNVIKYLWRRKDKGGDQDVQKSLWYFDKAKEIANGELSIELNARIKKRGTEND